MPQKKSSERFADWKKPKITENKINKYHWVVRHKDNLKLGNKTDIGAFTYIQAQEGVEIKDNVQVGSHCAIYSVSTIDRKKGKVVLNENSRIGSHSTIMPGVTVGKNAVVGAHSFVNRNVPDDCVAYGIPLRIIKNENPFISDQNNGWRYGSDSQSCKIKTILGKWQKV